MTKILEIEVCGNRCFYFESDMCWLKDKYFNKAEFINEFPDWCSLRDKPEPMTIEQYRKIRYDDGGDLNRYRELSEINAYFLGEDER